jgi:hypothetical protein
MLIVCAGAVASNDFVTDAAAYGLPPDNPPACDTVIVQVPGAIKSTVPLVVTVQTAGVDAVNDTARPEFVVAVTV